MRGKTRILDIIIILLAVLCPVCTYVRTDVRTTCTYVPNTYARYVCYSHSAESQLHVLKVPVYVYTYVCYSHSAESEGVHVCYSHSAESAGGVRVLLSQC